MILFENFVATLIHSKIQFCDLPDTRKCRSCSSWCRASPGRRCRRPPSPGHSHPPSPRELRCLPVSALALDLNFLLLINPKYGIFLLYLVNTMWCPPKPGNTINMNPTQSSSRSRRSKRLSGWTMVFACMRFFFNLNIFHWISHFQRGSSDKAVMAFTQGMLVSLQLVLRWI